MPAGTEALGCQLRGQRGRGRAQQGQTSCSVPPPGLSCHFSCVTTPVAVPPWCPCGCNSWWLCEPQGLRHFGTHLATVLVAPLCPRSHSAVGSTRTLTLLRDVPPLWPQSPCGPGARVTLLSPWLWSPRHPSARSWCPQGPGACATSLPIWTQHWYHRKARSSWPRGRGARVTSVPVTRPVPCPGSVHLLQHRGPARAVARRRALRRGHRPPVCCRAGAGAG